MIRSFILTFIHGAILVFIIVIFINVSVPNHNKKDSEAVFSVLKATQKYFMKSTPKSEPEKSVQKKEPEKNNPRETKTETQKPAPLVEDPF